MLEQFHRSFRGGRDQGEFGQVIRIVIGTEMGLVQVTWSHPWGRACSSGGFDERGGPINEILMGKVFGGRQQEETADDFVIKALLTYAA